MVGIDPQTDFTVGPWLKSGFDIKQLKDNEILIGSEAHLFTGRSEIAPGDSLMFYGREFVVAGILDETGIGIDDSGFVTLAAVYAMAGASDAQALLQLEIEPGQISSVMVDVSDESRRGEVAADIGGTVRGAAVVTSKELMSSSVAEQLENLRPLIPLIGAGFWFIAVLMIAALFSMIVNERRREIGLLQAMGATRRFVFGMVMLEAVELTALGGIIGLALGGLVIALSRGAISSSIGIAYLWPGAGFFGLFIIGFLAVSVLTGVLAALYPALVASRMEPYQAIRTGE